jgi:hypothetical protein
MLMLCWIDGNPLDSGGMIIDVSFEQGGLGKP